MMLDDLRSSVQTLDKLSDNLDTLRNRKQRLQDELATTNTDIDRIRLEVKAAVQAVKAASAALQD